MTVLALASHLAFCAGLAILSAVVVRAMIGARVMDRPNARKAHSVATPKGGGVGIVVAFMLGISVLYGFAGFARLADPYFRGVILAAAAIALVAFLDDLYDWPFVVKLGAQIAAALAVVGSGMFVRVYHIPLLGPVDLGWAGAVVTLFWIVFATNAVNFIDGLNGLAGGAALIACAFLAVIGADQQAWFVYFAAMLLGAGLVGFLPFNFPRARIFLGDVGSQFCGFMLAVLGVAAARFSEIPMSFLLVPMLLSGILFDVAFTLVRRVLAGENVAAAHRAHLYQLAHRAGMDARMVAAIHWGFAALGGVVALVFLRGPQPLLPVGPLLLLLVQAGWAIYVVRRARASAIGLW